jgi:hypothetical protein
MGGEVRVNATTAGDQFYPFAAMNDSGRAVIGWTSYGQDGSGRGVYAQQFAPLGAPVGGEFRVNATTDGDQTNAAVALDAAGNFVVTWASNGQDGSGYGVYAQRYNLLGLPVGGEFRVNTTATGDQTFPNVAMDWSGKFVVTWSSFGQDAAATWGVYAQRFDADGNKTGGEFRVNSTTAGDQAYSSVAMDASGDVLITWASRPSSASYWTVYAQQYAPNGSPLGGEFMVNTTTNANQQNPSVAMTNKGHVLSVWTGSGLGDPNGVYMQQYNISFSGESSDSFFAEGDPNDPDHDHDHDQAPTDDTPPVGVSVTPAADDHGGQGPVSAAPTVIDHALGAAPDLFQGALLSRGRHRRPGGHPSRPDASRLPFWHRHGGSRPRHAPTHHEDHRPGGATPGHP